MPRSVVRPQMFTLSRLMSAAIFSAGMGGWRESHSEPRSPCSSAVTKATSTDLFGGAKVAARAMASTVAHPEALSSAPL